MLSLMAQGSVLTPSLFNMYTNDQLMPKDTKHFIYADDLAITAQERTFENVDQKLETALRELSEYYKNNSFNPNPSKTQVSTFHLRSWQANRKLNVSWNNTTLEHTNKPTYLGVVLDRSLTYRYHCEKKCQKLTARNNILQKRANSKWGAKRSILRTTTQTLRFSTAEYAHPVWSRSTHAKVESQWNMPINNGLHETHSSTKTI